MSLVRRAIILGFAIAVLLVFAYIARHALLLIYVSGILAVVLSPAVDWISRRKIGNWHPSRGAAVMLMAVVLIGVIAGICIFAVPPVLSQAKDFVSQLPDLLDRLRNRLDSHLTGGLDVRSIPRYLTTHFSMIANIFGTLAGVVTSTATVLLLTAYLTIEGDRVLRWCMRFFPADQSTRLENTLRRAGCRMRNWLTGQLLLMLILGSASAVTFGAMQIKFFFLLALFAGVANFVPFLGPLVTVILAGSVAAMDSLWKALGVLIFYAAYQQVEAAILTPRIMQSEVKLSAAAVIISLLLGSEIAGIVGALVAVPSAVLVSALMNEYLAHRGAQSENTRTAEFA